MKVIYEPAGRAKEYADLALNIYGHCDIGCTYCYNKKVPWYREDIGRPKPKKNILDSVINDCKVLKEKGDQRTILLCFSCDPYPLHPTEDITTAVLQILHTHGRKVSILTKNGDRAARDFPLLDKAGWEYGVTLTCGDNLDPNIRIWEPDAPDSWNRALSLMTAHAHGIRTWVSLEPVIYPEKALYWIRTLHPYVDFWKVGKLNYYPEIEKRINWKAFVETLKDAFPKNNYYLKKDLMEAAK